MPGHQMTTRSAAVSSSRELTNHDFEHHAKPAVLGNKAAHEKKTEKAGSKKKASAPTLASLGDHAGSSFAQEHAAPTVERHQKWQT
jgi:hypothetical protein